MIRPLAALCAVAVIAAATHKNVVAGGGWTSPDAAFIVAVAALLAVGTAFAASTWAEGRRLAACLMLVGVIGGEVYWLAVNADRELIARETAMQPVRDAMAARSAARTRLHASEAALVAFDGTPRLAAALAAKAKADAVVASKAAEPGCASNCRQLLQAQIAAVAIEVDAARAAEAAERAALERAVERARATLDALPRPPAHATVASALGVPSWAYDVMLAGLRGVVIMTASLVLAIALHRTPAPLAREPEASVAHADLDAPRAASMQGPVVANAPHALPPPDPGHIVSFLDAVLLPAPGNSASVFALKDAYLAHCEATGVQPLHADQFGLELRRALETRGYVWKKTRDDVVVRGVKLSEAA